MGSAVCLQSCNNVMMTVQKTQVLDRCYLCGTNFNVPRAQGQLFCALCKNLTCETCLLPRPPDREYNSWNNKRPDVSWCRRCFTFGQLELRRDQITELPIRDLVWFLDKLKILGLARGDLSTEDTSEAKDKLVDFLIEACRTTSSQVRRDLLSSARQQEGSSVVYPSENNGRTESPLETVKQYHHAEAHVTSGTAQSDSSERTGDVILDNGVAITDLSSIQRVTLSHIRNESDIDQLSVRQLKYLLISNLVNFRGCVEKEELTERARRLWKSSKENNTQNSGHTAEMSFEDECRICMDAMIDCVLLECGHTVTCVECGRKLAECPICRQYVIRAVRLFKS